MKPLTPSCKTPGPLVRLRLHIATVLTERRHMGPWDLQSSLFPFVAGVGLADACLVVRCLATTAHCRVPQLLLLVAHSGSALTLAWILLQVPSRRRQTDLRFGLVWLVLAVLRGAALLYQTP